MSEAEGVGGMRYAGWLDRTWIRLTEFWTGASKHGRLWRSHAVSHWHSWLKPRRHRTLQVWIPMADPVPCVGGITSNSIVWWRSRVFTVHRSLAARYVPKEGRTQYKTGAYDWLHK